MSIKEAESNLWTQIVIEVDLENGKNVQAAINKLKSECKRVYSHKQP